MEELMTTRSTQTKTIISFVLFLLFALATGASADALKIAVASTGQEKDALISQQTGRAPFFLFFDDKGNLLEAIENPAKDQYGGISRSISLFLADKGVTLIISGDIGSKMEQALRDYQIEYTEKTGVAYDVVQTIIQNR